MQMIILLIMEKEEIVSQMHALLHIWPKALGYKNVYACVDTSQTNGSGHCWAEIDGLVYDPLFSEAKGYYKYFGASYRSYGLYPMRKVAI